MMKNVLEAVLLLAWCGAAAASKPNIVILVADDQGYANIGCKQP